MLQTVAKPRSDLSVKHRGGYQAGSRGRCDRKADLWGCKCVNCGQVFSNRRKLRLHYTDCQYFDDIQESQGQNIDIKVTSCFKCGERFSSSERLGYHSQRCGQHENMQQVNLKKTKGLERNKKDKEKGDTENYNGIVIEDESEPESEETIVIEDVKSVVGEEGKRCNEQPRKIMIASEKNVVHVHPTLDDHTGSENEDKTTDGTKTVKISEHVKHSIKFKTELLRETEIGRQKKRKYDVMLSTDSCDSHVAPEKLKITVAPLYKSLEDDIQQEQRNDRFDRLSTYHKAYKCSKCNVRFKYKHKFDIHVKYVHVPTGMLLAEKNVEDVNGVTEKSSNETYLTQNSASADRKNEESLQVITKSSANEISSVKLMMANYPCDFCYMSFRHYTRYQRHLKSAHAEQKKRVEFGNIYRCSECNERMSDKYALLKHYNNAHVRNREDDKLADEKVSDILDVKDIMNHLRRNLICLQDGQMTETDATLKITGTPLNWKAVCQLSSGPGNNLSHTSGCNSESRDDESRDHDLAVTDESKHRSETELTEKKNVEDATDLKCSVFYDKPLLYKGVATENPSERKQPHVGVSPHHQVNSGMTGNDVDAPIDLSMKLERPNIKTNCEPRDNTFQEMPIVDRKPSEYEKSLLLGYYKEFLHEYGFK